MKYSKKVFDGEVARYKRVLGRKANGKLMLVLMDVRDREAFFSIAALSKAVHELKGEIHVGVRGEEATNFKILEEVWDAYDGLKAGIINRKTSALKGFIDAANKRLKKGRIEEIFERPDIVLNAGKNGFEGKVELPYLCKWHKSYKWEKLVKVAEKIWRYAYNLRKGERASIGFVLVPEEKQIGLPLEDYLDSYSIAYALAVAAKRLNAKVSMGSSSDKASMLEKGVRSSQLISMLTGCEHCKDMKEEVFRKFKVLSKALRLYRLRVASASMGIHGKGYSGRFLFGDSIGYPTTDRKARWTSTGMMFLKDRYEMQTYHDKRMPMMRYALTETLPIKEFIETNDIDFDIMRRKGDRIKGILDRCDRARIVGGRNGCDFTVFLKEGKKRNCFNSENYEVRERYDKEFYSKTGIKAGLYANIPDGETFVTPIRTTGRIVGDVVIAMDQSVPIPKGKPLVVEVDKSGKYEVKSGAAEIVKKMVKLRKEAMQMIRIYEKSGSFPKRMIDMYKRNFNKIGEFAININPNARLSRYLIVNEKLAGMIHIALGSGFEPDRKTTYHWDIVIDAPKQRLDIYGIDKHGKRHFVMRKGRLVV